jgi:ribosomal protein L11 methyltransferase
MTGNYIELVFTVLAGEEYVSDVLMNSLAEIGFDSFDQNELGFRAYIPSHLFSEDNVQEALMEFKDQFTFSYEINLIPYKNWNEVWESNFPSITIGDRLYIYADFHEVKEYPYQIKIHPKMAFGTGHHETTFQMAEVMLDIDFNNKDVLDMGCGTGILAILAHLKGAKHLTAIDNDPIAADSCLENAELNNMKDAEIFCGDASSLEGKNFDIILANINRNILLNDMEAYANSLRNGGTILFSGFYTEDLEMIKESAERNGMYYQQHQHKNNWVVATFKKR